MNMTDVDIRTTLFLLQSDKTRVFLCVRANRFVCVWSECCGGFCHSNLHFNRRSHGVDERVYRRLIRIRHRITRLRYTARFNIAIAVNSYVVSTTKRDIHFINIFLIDLLNESSYIEYVYCLFECRSML